MVHVVVPVRLNTEASSLLILLVYSYNSSALPHTGHGCSLLAATERFCLFNRTDLVVDPDVVDFLGLLFATIGGRQ